MEQPPPIVPFDATGLRTAQVGTGLWALAFLGLLPFSSQLSADGHLWWLWTCLAGVGLGLLGWEYCRRRAAASTKQDEPPASERVSGQA